MFRKENNKNVYITLIYFTQPICFSCFIKKVSI